MFILTFILDFMKKIGLDKIWILLLSITTAVILKKNSNLQIENKDLKTTTESSKKTIKIQKKVLNAVQNNSDSDLRSNLKRMYKSEL